jgi:hypothetical protein
MRKIMTAITIFSIGIIGTFVYLSKSNANLPAMRTNVLYSNVTDRWTMTIKAISSYNNGASTLSGSNIVYDLLWQPTDVKDYYHITYGGGNCISGSCSNGKFTSTARHKINEIHLTWKINSGGHIRIQLFNENTGKISAPGSSTATGKDNGIGSLYNDGSYWRSNTAIFDWGNNASGANWNDIPSEIINESTVNWNFSTEKKSVAKNGATYNAGSYVDCGIPGLTGSVSNNGNDFNCSGTVSAVPEYYDIKFFNAGVNGGSYTMSKQIEVLKKDEPIVPVVPSVANNPSIGKITIKNGKLKYTNLYGKIVNKKISYKKKVLTINQISPKYVGKILTVNLSITNGKIIKSFVQKVKVGKFIPGIIVKMNKIIIRKKGVFAKNGYVKISNKKIKVKKGVAKFNIIKLKSGKHTAKYTGNSQFSKTKKVFRLSN